MSIARSQQTRKMVIAAMFTAIVIAFNFIPYIGYIDYIPGLPGITTIHIPVIICALILGWQYGLYIGGVWGVCCLINAFLKPIPANVPFQNPLISVMPRILVGLVAPLVFALMYKIFAKKKETLRNSLSAGIAAVCATLTNTILVLTMLGVFNAFGTSTVAETFRIIFSAIIALNVPIELAAALIICPLLYNVLIKIYRGQNH